MTCDYFLPNFLTGVTTEKSSSGAISAFSPKRYPQTEGCGSNSPFTLNLLFQWICICILKWSVLIYIFVLSFNCGLVAFYNY